MSSLKWSISDAVFVTEIDDQHKEIFEILSNFQETLAAGGSLPEVTKRLIDSVAGHFAHEERLMRAARYGSIRWHKEKHNAARKRAGELATKIEHGDTGAGFELVEYLTSWLHGHTRVADRMMAAFLRNQRRSMCKITFRAGTKPMGAGVWVNVKGDPLDLQNP